MGFADFAGYSDSFYEALTKLKNLQILVMRDTLCPTNEYTPQAALLAVLTEIYYEAQDSRVSNWCLEDFMMDMDDQGYPLGDALDPFGLGFDPCEEDFSLQGWAQELAESTYFSRDYLKDLIPALRTCHIGTDSPDPKTDIYHSSIDFNETIFTLPHLQKLCITGAKFWKFGLQQASIDNRAASLKELLLLNCCVSAEDLTLMVRFSHALERLTIRVLMSLKSQYEEDDYVFFSERLSFQHSKSLEYLDLDIYGGADHGLDLNPFDVLKEIIITPHSILGDPDEEMIMARSLQRLTIRYEEGTRLPLNSILKELENKNLPNMRSVICQIPDNICEGTTSSEICVEAEAFKPDFKELGVELSTELVPYPLTMPKYDTCPCENLTFFHQFPSHPRVKSRPPNDHTTNTTDAGHSNPHPAGVISFDDYDTYYDDPYEDDHPSLYDMSPPTPPRIPTFTDYDDYCDWAYYC